MKALNHLRKLITDENWFRHLLAFIGTIIGIVIALELDKRREAQDDQDKLNGFLTLVDNELRVNQARLTNLNKGHTLNLAAINFAYSKKRIGGTFFCLVSQRDSLFERHPEMVDYIHEVGRIGNDSAKYTSSINVQDDREISIDSWEMIKSSGLMSELDPLVAFQYSEIYKSLRSTSDLYNVKKFIEVVQQSKSDNKLSDVEVLEIRDMLESMKLLNEIKIKAVKTGLDHVREMKGLPIDPNDSLKLEFEMVDN